MKTILSPTIHAPSGTPGSSLPKLARSLVLGLGCFCCAVAQAGGPDVQLTIHAEQSGSPINPAMWGVFFEDINLGADGGLYAELVKNRSFEFPEPLMGWSKVASGTDGGRIEILDASPFNSENPHYLRISTDGVVPFGVSNEGFRGMGIRPDETYDFSVAIRVTSGSPELVARLIGADGKLLGSGRLTKLNADWKKCSTRIRTVAGDPKAVLQVLVVGQGVVDLDMVSLFPQHTWKNRPGGLRADLVQMLADLKPGFVRFPGGCIVEGRYLTNRYEWKKTIGLPEERKLIINRWNNEFKHRPTPDYYQSFGLGFYEFFQMCEDIGSEPLPILNCGMACQFNSSELVPLDQLDPYIQDALDLIEFANGPASTAWGGRRAALGHPAPFRLKLLGVGNEQWGPQYLERYARFAQALKEKYPEIQLISSAGPSPADDRFRSAWSKLRELNADIVDEHCYDAPAWFLNNASRYDNYDRKGPKVFMGEYAAQSVATGSPNNRNTLECALAEAAYMTGLERNADVVRMASYAPLFAHSDGWQWTPDLIWCDNTRVYGTPSYYVQMLFSRNRGDVVLRTDVATAPGSPRFFSTASVDAMTGEIILKAVNPSANPVSGAIDISGWSATAPRGRIVVMAGSGPQDENSFASPYRITPLGSTLQGVTPHFHHTFPPYSMSVLRIGTAKR